MTTTQKHNDTAGPQPDAAVGAIFGSIGKIVTGTAGDYVQRNGVSNGTVEDSLSVGFESALKIADKMDGTEDGIIHRAALEKVLGKLLPEKTKDAKTAEDMQTLRDAIRSLPEQLPVPPVEFTENAVKDIVSQADKDHDGRLSQSELKGLEKQVISAIGGMANKVQPSAIPQHEQQQPAVPAYVAPLPPGAQVASIK